MKFETCEYLPELIRHGRVQEDIKDAVEKAIATQKIIKVSELGRRERVTSFASNVRQYCRKRQIPVKAYTRGLEVYLQPLKSFPENLDRKREL